MGEPADRNEPIVRTATAVRDVAATVEFIRKRRGTDKVNLLGWSWALRSWACTPPRTTRR
jgi:hypothetical protein